MSKKASHKGQSKKTSHRPKVVLPKANETMTVRGAWSIKGLLK